MEIQNIPEPINTPSPQYRLQVTGAYPDRVAKIFSHLPIRKVIDHVSMSHFQPESPALQQALSDNWASIASVICYKVMQEKILHTQPNIERWDVPKFVITEQTDLESGTRRILATTEKKIVTAYIAPPDGVPFAFRPWELLPKSSLSVPVSANLSYIAKNVRDNNIYAVTAAGLTSFYIYADAVMLQPGIKESESMQAFITDTAVSIDARRESLYYTTADFFKQLESPVSGQEWKGLATRDPRQEPHWIITTQNGDFSIIGLRQLLSLNAQQRESILSISPILGHVTESVFHNPGIFDEDNRQMVNAVMTFDGNGVKRVGSLHGNAVASIKSMYSLAKHILSPTYSGIQNLSIGVLDGGGASGAVVRMGHTWSDSVQSADIQTLPHIPVIHTVPAYTGLVSREYIGKSY